MQRFPRFFTAIARSQFLTDSALWSGSPLAAPGRGPSFTRRSAMTREQKLATFGELSKLSGIKTA